MNVRGASVVKPTVVFLHGMARTHGSMARLRKRVEAAGYPTWARTYQSRRFPIEELTDKVASAIKEDLGEDAAIIGVTHSLGGILVRHMADKLNWRGLVMLAPPNSGSLMAKRFKNNPLYRWYYGPVGQQLDEGMQWPMPPKPFAIIAGTKGGSVGNPSSWISGALGVFPPGEKNDGTVSVSEARLEGMTDFDTVDADHTWIMNHPEVAAMVLHFLEHRSLRH